MWWVTYPQKFPCNCVQRPYSAHRSVESPKRAGRSFGILTSAWQFGVPLGNRNFQSSKKNLLSQFSKSTDLGALGKWGKQWERTKLTLREMPEHLQHRRKQRSTQPSSLSANVGEFICPSDRFRAVYAQHGNSNTWAARTSFYSPHHSEGLCQPTLLWKVYEETTEAQVKGTKLSKKVLTG